MNQLIEKLEPRINNSLAKLITDAAKPLLDKVAALESKVSVSFQYNSAQWRC